ncbi:MAG: STAS domain-containing protein [Deltaproteobacteria bacterium]|nr:STAS domain-containing protein [Deltaproteobacteria bacterium]
MQIAEERIGNALVLRPSGRLDGTTAADFERAVLARFDPPPGKLLLDLAELEYVSSAGLRAILMAAKRGKGVGCPLAVCRARDHIREVFEVSGFGSVLTLYGTLQQALDS